MIQDDQDQICSNSNGGCGENSIVRSSKKLKQIKVPQRGLGVAQLEKIRMEEQQKNDTKFSPPPTESIPYTPPSPPHPLMQSNFPLSGPLTRTNSMPNTENYHMDSLPLPNPTTNGGGFGSRWTTVHAKGNLNLSKLWHHELFNDHLGENSSCMRDLSWSNGACSIAQLADVTPKAQYYQHHQPSASLVNNDVSSTNLTSSSSCSSMPNFSLESPSNQISFSNYSSLWPDDQKVMFGTKRPCPFSLDDPRIPVFRSTFAPNTNLLNGTEEPTSCQNRGTMHNLDLPIFRDFVSWPGVTHEPTTSLKNTKSQIGNSSEELLTIASSSITSSFPNSISKQSALLLPSNKKDLCNFKTLPYQESFDNALVVSRNGGSSQQPKCISLFPFTKLEVTSESPPASSNGCNGEVGENIDLNLRL